MRRILLSCACAAVLMLPAAASAGARGQAKPGFLVVRMAAGDGGLQGRPVVTLVIEGFVIGRITQEARVDIYQLPTAGGEGAPQAAGPDVSTSGVRWHGFVGKEYLGSGFRFRAMGAKGAAYRVVVRGAGVYLFAGGHGTVTLRGSSVYQGADGAYSVDGRPFSSLPPRPLRIQIGPK